MIIVYKATFENKKYYIGLSRNSLNQRISEHKYRMKDKKYNYPFYNALRKYGFDSVKWEIISTHEYMKDAEDQEIKLIATTPNNYNIAVGGNTIVYTDELRKRISDGLKGKPKSEACKENISHTLKEYYKNDVNLTNMANRIKIAMNRPETRERYLASRLTIDMEKMQKKRNETIKRKQESMYLTLQTHYVKGMHLTELAKITKISYQFIRKHKEKWMIE